MHPRLVSADRDKFAMIEYKGYFIMGTALMIHPNSPDRRALGTVFVKTPQGAIVEVDRIGGPVFMTKEAA